MQCTVSRSCSPRKHTALPSAPCNVVRCIDADTAPDAAKPDAARITSECEWRLFAARARAASRAGWILVASRAHVFALRIVDHRHDRRSDCAQDQCNKHEELHCILANAFRVCVRGRYDRIAHKSFSRFVFAGLISRWSHFYCNFMMLLLLCHVTLHLLCDESHFLQFHDYAMSRYPFCI